MKKKQRNIILLAVIVAAVVLVIVTAVLLVNRNLLVQERGTYAGQMKLAQEKYDEGDYAAAEQAYLTALGFELSAEEEADALTTLSDFYTNLGKPDKSITLLELLQEKYPDDSRSYGRMIALCIEAGNIPAANAQTAAAFERGMKLDSPLLAAAPGISPAGGTFNEPVTVKLGADGNIFYTLDGSIPGLESTPYAESFSLRSTQPVTLTAAVIFDNGLLGWPARVNFTIDFQLAVNADGLDSLGKSAAEIMSSRGPLFYVEPWPGGFKYRDKSSRFFYVFRNDVFGEGQTPDNTALPGAAQCRVIQTRIDALLISVNYPISVTELMEGLNVTEYGVDPIGEGGPHLICKIKGLTYDFSLQDENTVIGSKNVSVFLES